MYLYVHYQWHKFCFYGFHLNVHYLRKQVFHRVVIFQLVFLFYCFAMREHWYMYIRNPNYWYKLFFLPPHQLVQYCGLYWQKYGVTVVFTASALFVCVANAYSFIVFRTDLFSSFANICCLPHFFLVNKHVASVMVDWLAQL